MSQNASYRKRVLQFTGTVLANTTQYITLPFACDQYARLCGWCQSVQNVSVLGQQGDSDAAGPTFSGGAAAANMTASGLPFQDTQAITGSVAGEGTGGKFSFEIIAEKAVVAIKNATGTNSVVTCSVNLRAVQ